MSDNENSIEIEHLFMEPYEEEIIDDEEIIEELEEIYNDDEEYSNAENESSVSTGPIFKNTLNQNIITDLINQTELESDVLMHELEIKIQTTKTDFIKDSGVKLEIFTEQIFNGKTDTKMKNRLLDGFKFFIDSTFIDLNNRKEVTKLIKDCGGTISYILTKHVKTHFSKKKKNLLKPKLIVL